MRHYPQIIVVHLDHTYKNMHHNKYDVIITTFNNFYKKIHIAKTKADLLCGTIIIIVDSSFRHGIPDFLTYCGLIWSVLSCPETNRV